MSEYIYTIHDIAEVIYKIHKDKYMCHSITKNIFYQKNNDKIEFVDSSAVKNIFIKTIKELFTIYLFIKKTRFGKLKSIYITKLYLYFLFNYQQCFHISYSCSRFCIFFLQS